MESPNLPMPGYKAHEYLLVLRPHQELWDRIVKLKESFATSYKLHSNRPTKPHIALVQFTNWSMMEERLIQRLHTIAMGIIPFKVELKDFGTFPTHTIYIQVLSREPLKELTNSLKEARRLMTINQEFKPHFLEEPVIPLARKLKPWQYEKGWLEYAHRQFTGRFIADNMLLLKRPSGDKGPYQILQRFEFQNLPVATRQGQLFSC
ncbi:MAG TPA: 2'-5' RNA ligase family protein [Flavisolibacter sp.]|jgi:2'-5' RNA ligase|nr:2'-5' RNA ligase family protein [Flavisolibacter sp.]